MKMEGPFFTVGVVKVGGLRVLWSSLAMECFWDRHGSDMVGRDYSL
jgi:hypothetical protein